MNGFSREEKILLIADAVKTHVTIRDVAQVLISVSSSSKDAIILVNSIYRSEWPPCLRKALVLIRQETYF